MKILLSFFLYAALVAECNGQTKRSNAIPHEVNFLLEKYSCNGCHTVLKVSVGPSFLDISKRNYSTGEIVNLIKSPNPNNWISFGAMPKIDSLKDSDVQKISVWINTLNKP